MIVDTSAIVAIWRGESDADRCIEALSLVAEPRMSAGTHLQTAVAVDANHDPVLRGRLDDLLVAARVQVEPVTKRRAEIARQAYHDFGKGSGHPAGLNLGDCFACALARASGKPLLFKGDDFTKTDVASALDRSADGR